MAKPVVIKKYENRRLYDTSGSRYVNLPEIAQMIRDGVDVEVYDARTGDDITSLILTQIIVDDTRNKKSALPLDFLRSLIIASDRVMRDFVGWYAQAAATAQRGAQQAFESSPFSSALPFIEKIIEVARPRDGAAEARPASRRTAEPAGADELETVATLREKIDELERKLKGRSAPRKRTRRPGGRSRPAPDTAPADGSNGTGEGR